MAHTFAKEVKSIFKFRPSRSSTPEPPAHHPEGSLHRAEITGSAMTASTTPFRSPPPAPQSPILIELFQSQGCNSCPPTNSNLISFMRSQTQTPPSGEEYILLTYQVTYWNYLGWTDTFSLPANDTRQREYVRRMGLKAAYTPMVVVNGRGVGVGNTKSDVDRILRDGTKTQAAAARVPVHKVLDFQNAVDERDVSGVTIEVDAMGLTPTSKSYAAHPPSPQTQKTQHLEIWEVTYTATAQDVHISHGENAGRTLPHLNVVKDVRRIGYLERGAKGQFRVGGPADRRDNQVEGRVVIVQDGKGGEVLGVLKV